MGLASIIGGDVSIAIGNQGIQSHDYSAMKQAEAQAQAIQASQLEARQQRNFELLLIAAGATVTLLALFFIYRVTNKSHNQT